MANLRFFTQSFSILNPSNPSQSYYGRTHFLSQKIGGDFYGNPIFSKIINYGVFINGVDVDNGISDGGDAYFLSYGFGVSGEEIASEGDGEILYVSPWLLFAASSSLEEPKHIDIPITSANIAVSAAIYGDLL